MKTFWKKVSPFIKLLLFQDICFGIVFTIYEIVTEWGGRINNFLDGLYAVVGGIGIASMLGGALFLGTTITYFIFPKMPEKYFNYFDKLSCIIMVDLVGILGYVSILTAIFRFFNLIELFVLFAVSVYGVTIYFIIQDWKRNKYV